MQSAVRPLRLSLGAEGDLLGWLVAGPYPDPGAFQLRGTGFNGIYPAEKELESREFDWAVGQPGAPHAWRLLMGTRSRGLDLVPTLGSGAELFAYCTADLIAPRDEAVQLLFGSDDGARVFLNGTRVFSKEVPRGVRRDEDRVVLPLKRGRNHLLFKIEQLNQGWGLMARLVDGAGRPVRGVAEELQIRPSGGDYRELRSVAGTAGAVDVEALERYLQIMDTAGRWAKTFLSSSRPTEAPAPAVSGLREALRQAEDAVKAPQTASALTSALRTSDLEVKSAYDAARRPLMKWAQQPGPLWPGGSASEDFIRVMPGGRYFVHSDGRPFTPVGYNHNPDWTELGFGNPLAEHYDLGRVDRWFSNLQAHRVNLIRLMVETPQSGTLEERPGVYRPEQVVWLDNVMSSAQRHGVRLWVTPYDTFWMNRRADASPYWAANGGPIVHPVDFLTKPSIIALQKRRMQFLIDRYGGSGTVFAWEIMNEIDLWWGASPEQIRAWTDQMATFVRRYQRRRWGRDHLVTLSFGEPEPKGLNAETAFRRPDLDFATMHLYLGASRGPSPGQEWQAANDYAAGVRYARAQVRDNRPVIDGESGPIDRWITDEPFDDEVFHLMSWSHLLAGGAGAGTRWPYRNPHHLTPGMLETLRMISLFCESVPWSKLTGSEVAATVDGDRARVFATGSAAIVWVRGSGPLRLSWPGGPVRAFGVFDVGAGKWVSGVQPVVAGGQIELTLPRQTHEAAIWLDR